MDESTQPTGDQREHAQVPAEGPEATAPETQPSGRDERHHSEEQAEGTQEAAES